MKRLLNFFEIAIGNRANKLKIRVNWNKKWSRMALLNKGCQGPRLT